jgi:tRNA(His) guanylyltransferase
MACSKYEYVKDFEIQTKLLPSTYIVIRIDGRGFTKFCEAHEYEKPNDIRGINLMNKAAQSVMEAFQDIWLAYGQSDEYSFVLRKNSNLFNRRAEKISTTITSCFASAFVLHFKSIFGDKELKEVPMFDGRCVCYPDERILKDYLTWRQVDCHINNLYNTCFWCLVQKDNLSTEEAHKRLKGTQSGEKNELLFSKFGLNYTSIEPVWRKGSIFIRIPREKVVDQSTKEEEKADAPVVQEDTTKVEKDKNSKPKNKPQKISPPKLKWDLVLIHEDLIQESFWEKYNKSVLL